MKEKNKTNEDPTAKQVDKSLAKNIWLDHVHRELLKEFHPKCVLAAMESSGSFAAVCSEFGIECYSEGLGEELDASSARLFHRPAKYDFIWIDYPEWNMGNVLGNPRCIANAATIEEYFLRLDAILKASRTMLLEDGHLALLIREVYDSLGHLAIPSKASFLASLAGLNFIGAAEVSRNESSVCKKLQAVCFVFEACCWH